MPVSPPPATLPARYHPAARGGQGAIDPAEEERTVEEVTYDDHIRGRARWRAPRRPASLPTRGLGAAPIRAVPAPIPVSEAVMSVAVTVDGRGRCGLAEAASALGWDTTTPLAVGVEPDGVITVRVAQMGTARTFSVDARGRLTVPAGVRQLASLRPGEAVLVLARPEADRAELYTAPALLSLRSGDDQTERKEDDG